MRTLMLGNGLNRCIESEISWGDILKDIKNEYEIYDGVSNDISFPMQFECIVNYIQKNKEPSIDIYAELKGKIAKKVQRINELDYKNMPHISFLDLEYKTILTTNYDYVLEELFEKYLDKERMEINDSETKYSLYRYKQFNGSRIYHIHGEANVPNSLCLGYEHYAGIIEKMRKEISVKSKTSGGTPRIIELLKQKKSYKNEQMNWAIHFFTDDIDIVGLELSESEIDLWWLITYRAYLKFSHPMGRKLINNQIRYHTTKKLDLEEETNVRKNMFKNMGIDYIEYDLIDKNYRTAYFKIAENISSRNR